MTTIVVPNETNSKASEFQISVSKRKLSHEMTQQQHSKRQMIENIPLTGQPTLAAAATESQHRRISNRLLEMQSVKPSKSCSTLQGYTIIHSDTLSQLVTSFTLCIQCSAKKKACSAQYQIDTSQAGLKEYLNLYCHNCGYEKKFSTSCSFKSKDTASVSTNVRNISDINLRASYAIISAAGGGHTSLSKFCNVMDLRKPVTITNYNCHVKKISIIAAEECEQNMLGAAKHLKSFLKRNEDEIVDVAVTADGIWQKRYGHNSTLGVTFVIPADTGEVLDYEVKSCYCKKCQYTTGDHDCSKNHPGSSDSMEKISAAEMFC